MFSFSNFCSCIQKTFVLPYFFRIFRNCSPFQKYSQILKNVIALENCSKILKMFMFSKNVFASIFVQDFRNCSPFQNLFSNFKKCSCFRKLFTNSENVRDIIKLFALFKTKSHVQNLIKI